ncbi:MAG TPA: c-type cytochrome domain-containing protein, partial [Planctomycetota bacterium]|nr:c-type cytochrome domain-containing protein [Planctomycetota bacterium]
MKASRNLLACLALTALGFRASAAEQDAAVTYQDQVLPIFTTHCLGCHNADKKKGDLDLSSYSAALAGGGSGELAAAGDSGGSLLFKVVAHLAEPKMPPKKPKISDAEIAVLKKWIEGGLIDAPGGKAKKSKAPKVDLALQVPAAGKPKGPAAMPLDLLLEPAVHTPRAEAVTALAASPWAPVGAVAGQHQVLLYNTDTLELAGVLPYPERRPTVLRFSRSGGLLLAGGGHGAKLGRVVAWDVTSGDRVFEIGEEFDQVLAMDLSSDQSHVALGGPGKLVKIYSTRDGELEHSIKKHTDWVTSMEFSPDGVLLATGDRSGGLHVWEARTGRILYTLAGHKGGITDISW